MKWRDKNFGKSPFDPDYIEGYDADADKEAYDEACEEREQRKKERKKVTNYDYHCKDCSQNTCGWCAFRDCPTRDALSISANQSVTINPYNYSSTTIGNKENEK